MSDEEGFVLQAIKGKVCMNGFYYQGDGEWGQFEHAKIYYSRRTMRSGIKEAKETMPVGATEIAAFGVFLP